MQLQFHSDWNDYYQQWVQSVRFPYCEGCRKKRFIGQLEVNVYVNRNEKYCIEEKSDHKVAYNVI